MKAQDVQWNSPVSRVQLPSQTRPPCSVLNLSDDTYLPSIPCQVGSYAI